MPKFLKDLQVAEISLVDHGAGEGCVVAFSKQEAPLTTESIEKTLKATPKADLPETVTKLLASGQDMTKHIVDLLESRIVKRPGDRNSAYSWGASFTGYSPRDPIGKAILSAWHENDRERLGITKAAPKAKPDKRDGRMTEPTCSDLGSMVADHMAKNPHASRSQALSAVLSKSGDQYRKADGTVA